MTSPEAPEATGNPRGAAMRAARRRLADAAPSLFRKLLDLEQLVEEASREGRRLAGQDMSRKAQRSRVRSRALVALTHERELEAQFQELLAEELAVRGEPFQPRRRPPTTQEQDARTARREARLRARRRALRKVAVDNPEDYLRLLSRELPALHAGEVCDSTARRRAHRGLCEVFPIECAAAIARESERESALQATNAEG